MFEFTGGFNKSLYVSVSSLWNKCSIITSQEHYLGIENIRIKHLAPKIEGWGGLNKSSWISITV